MTITMRYRKNVGIVVLKDCKIFAGHRMHIPSGTRNGWQMPQGGIDDGEDIIEAGLRELYEETGIMKSKVKLIAKMPTSLRYDFPSSYVPRKGFEGFCGQEQYWLVFEFLGEDGDVNLKATREEQEFDEWKWETTDFLLNNVIEFKKSVYEKVFQWIESDIVH